MTLNTSRRTSIFQKLVPILGEADADALMAEFPATEYDQLVTRDHLRAELALMRTEIKTIESGIRVEMHGLFARAYVVMAGAIGGSLIGGMGLAAAIG